MKVYHTRQGVNPRDSGARAVACVGQILYNTGEAIMIKRSRGHPAIFFLLLFPLLLDTAGASAQPGRNFLWEVTHKSGTVYLLGSVHYMKQTSYPLSREIEDAFERSGTLAVEADVSDPSGIDILAMAENAVYPGDETIERHVSGETLELLKREFLSLGMPAGLLIKQKPWFLAMTLESLALMSAGYSPAHGIDSYFLSRAGKRQVIELESVDFQFRLLSNLSDAEQEAMLLHTLREKDAIPRKADDIVRAWKTGDAAAMEQIISRDSDNSPRMTLLYEKLLYERNRNMAVRIESILKKGGTAFVVVGAGHLVGDRGILAILKGQGYRIRQL